MANDVSRTGSGLAHSGGGPPSTLRSDDDGFWSVDDALPPSVTEDAGVAGREHVVVTDSSVAAVVGQRSSWLTCSSTLFTPLMRVSMADKQIASDSLIVSQTLKPKELAVAITRTEYTDNE